MYIFDEVVAVGFHTLYYVAERTIAKDMKQPPLLLRKLNLVPYPVQLAEINTERKVQQQEQKLHTDIVPIGTQHPFGKTICTHIIICRKDLSERSNAFRQQFLFQKNPRNKGKR